MSESEATPQVNELLEKGIKAARAGENAAARQYLEQVVQMDQYNEKGWFWLAAVVDSVEEKRVCLGNVVVINPNNQRAQNLLNRLEEEEIPQSVPTAGSSQGVSRRAVYAAIGLGVVAVVFLVIVLVVLAGGGDDEGDTSAGGAGGDQPAVTSVAAAAGATESATEEAPTPTREVTILPATWTPVPTPTSRILPTSTPLAAVPSNIGGTIIMQSGQVVGDEVNQPIWIVSPDGSNLQQVTPGNDRGHTPILSPDSSRYAYIKFATGTREVVLLTDNMSGNDPVWVSTRWGGNPILLDQDTPAWSPDGARMAFTALGPSAVAPDLYVLSMLGEDSSPEALTQLTADEASESWPAFSPDSQSLVYVVEEQRGGQTVTELRRYDFGSGFISDLTANGADLAEAAPDWSPDGQSIIFEGRDAESGKRSIYRMPADGSGEPDLLIESESSDIRPRYSPDGRYIVFSSDRTGNWDVFIHELASGTTYQLTSGQQTDIANDWGR